MSAKEYADILTQYPDTITKEQMYQICHISKRTALYLLESGLVPSQCTGKKTRKYTIATVDVIAYLIQRERDPDKFTPPVGWYKPDGKINQIRIASIVPPLSPECIERMRQLFIDILTPYPDLLNVSDIVEITGYCSTSVVNWCEKRYIHRFLIHRKYLIPKESLLDFMMSERFRKISVKSEKHRAYNAQILASVLD